MTDVIIAPRVEDPLSDIEPVVSGAWFRLRPSLPITTGGQWVQNVWPENVTYINGAAVTVKLDPLTDNPYELELTLPDGDGGYVTRTEYRIVTDSASPLNWQTLELRNAPGTSPTPTGDWAAAIADLQAQINSLSVAGASTLNGITDMTALARTFNAQTSTTGMRSTIGAGTSNLAIGTTTGTAADGGTVATLSGTVTTQAGTITTLSSSLSGKANTSDIAATPIFLGTVSGTYPARPATTRPVVFTDPLVQPTNNGSTSGGGGMVPGLDYWIS